MNENRPVKLSKPPEPIKHPEVRLSYHERAFISDPGDVILKSVLGNSTLGYSPWYNPETDQYEIGIGLSPQAMDELMAWWEKHRLSAKSRKEPA